MIKPKGDKIILKTIKIKRRLKDVYLHLNLLTFTNASDQYKAQKKCEKVMFFYILEYFPNKDEIRRVCDKVLDRNLYMLKYCPDRYKNRKMCE